MSNIKRNRAEADEAEQQERPSLLRVSVERSATDAKAESAAATDDNGSVWANVDIDLSKLNKNEIPQLSAPTTTCDANDGATGAAAAAVSSSSSSSLTPSTATVVVTARRMVLSLKRRAQTTETAPPPEQEKEAGGGASTGGVAATDGESVGNNTIPKGNGTNTITIQTPPPPPSHREENANSSAGVGGDSKSINTTSTTTSSNLNIVEGKRVLSFRRAQPPPPLIVTPTASSSSANPATATTNPTVVMTAASDGGGGGGTLVDLLVSTVEEVEKKLASPTSATVPSTLPPRHQEVTTNTSSPTTTTAAPRILSLRRNAPQTQPQQQASEEEKREAAQDDNSANMGENQTTIKPNNDDDDDDDNAVHSGDGEGKGKDEMMKKTDGENSNNVAINEEETDDYIGVEVDIEAAMGLVSDKNKEEAKKKVDDDEGEDNGGDNEEGGTDNTNDDDDDSDTDSNTSLHLPTPPGLECYNFSASHYSNHFYNPHQQQQRQEDVSGEEDDDKMKRDGKTVASSTTTTTMMPYNATPIGFAAARSKGMFTKHSKVGYAVPPPVPLLLASSSSAAAAASMMGSSSPSGYSSSSAAAAAAALAGILTPNSANAALGGGNFSCVTPTSTSNGGGGMMNNLIMNSNNYFLNGGLATLNQQQQQTSSGASTLFFNATHNPAVPSSAGATLASNLLAAGGGGMAINSLVGGSVVGVGSSTNPQITSSSNNSNHVNNALLGPFFHPKNFEDLNRAVVQTVAQTFINANRSVASGGVNGATFVRSASGSLVAAHNNNNNNNRQQSSMIMSPNTFNSNSNVHNNTNSSLPHYNSGGHNNNAGSSSWGNIAGGGGGGNAPSSFTMRSGGLSAAQSPMIGGGGAFSPAYGSGGGSNLPPKTPTEMLNAQTSTVTFGSPQPNSSLVGMGNNNGNRVNTDTAATTNTQQEEGDKKQKNNFQQQRIPYGFTASGVLIDERGFPIMMVTPPQASSSTTTTAAATAAAVMLASPPPPPPPSSVVTANGGESFTAFVPLPESLRVPIFVRENRANNDTAGYFSGKATATINHRQIVAGEMDDDDDDGLRQPKEKDDDDTAADGSASKNQQKQKKDKKKKKAKNNSGEDGAQKEEDENNSSPANNKTKEQNEAELMKRHAITAAKRSLQFTFPNPNAEDLFATALHPFTDTYDFDPRDKMGEGTYGAVYIGYSRPTRKNPTRSKVAIKLLKQLPNFEGFPITSVREISVHRYLRSVPEPQRSKLLVVDDVRFEYVDPTGAVQSSLSSELQQELIAMNQRLPPSLQNLPASRKGLVIGEVIVFLVSPLVEHTLSSLRSSLRLHGAGGSSSHNNNSHGGGGGGASQLANAFQQGFDHHHRTSHHHLNNQPLSPLCLNEEFIVFIFIQILEGLNQLHKARIMHRDIKEDNILVTRDGEVKICDFGLAVPLEGERAKITPSLIVMFYRPPEMLLGADHYSTAVDIWSAGCLLAQQFLGVPPFITKDGQPTNELGQLKIIADVMGPLPAKLLELANPEVRAILFNHPQRDLIFERGAWGNQQQPANNGQQHQHQSHLQNNNNGGANKNNAPMTRTERFNRFRLWFDQMYKARRRAHINNVALEMPTLDTLIAIFNMLALDPAQRPSAEIMMKCAEKNCSNRFASNANLMGAANDANLGGGSLSLRSMQTAQSLQQTLCWSCRARSRTAFVKEGIAKLPPPKTHLRPRQQQPQQQTTAAVATAHQQQQ